MTLLYLEDSYMKECVARVVSVNDAGVVLDQTVFFPSGGGQPHDTGIFWCGDDSFRVVDVRKINQQVVHVLDAPGVLEGMTVTCAIDWPRRYALMRAHTASHIVSSVVHKEFGALITGNQLSVDQFRVDFSLEHFDREVINTIIAKSNQYLSDNLPVSVSSLPRTKALELPGMIKLAGVLPPNVEVLRIVSIGHQGCFVDQQADGGTHVRSTAEVGLLELLRAENKGRANRRLYVRLSNTKL